MVLLLNFDIVIHSIMYTYICPGALIIETKKYLLVHLICILHIYMCTFSMHMLP